MDGLVDRAGGPSLRSELRRFALREREKRLAHYGESKFNAANTAGRRPSFEWGGTKALCPVGQAVALAPPAGSLLRQRYSVVVHTATPAWPQCPSGVPQWRVDVLACYMSSLLAAARCVKAGGGRDCVVVSTLICAGTRGAPEKEAAEVAAEAAAEWLSLSTESAGNQEAAVVDGSGGVQGLWFALRTEETADLMLRCFESTLGPAQGSEMA